MATSDLETLVSIFSNRPDLQPNLLQHILVAHSGDLSRACDYILSLSEPQQNLTLPDSLPTDIANTPFQSLQPSLIDLSDPAHATNLIENFKDIVIPALKTQLTGLQFPNLCGEDDRVKYTLAGLTLSSITLDPVHVNVEVTSARDIKVSAIDVALAVDVNHWTYRLRFPPIRDAGRAHLAFAGVKADILLVVNDHDSSLTIDNCNCSITGAISFRANDARLSWLYNTLAPMLKNSLKPTLETSLATAIRSGLEGQLDDWTSLAN